MNDLQTFEAEYREYYGLVSFALDRIPGLKAHADDLIEAVFMSYWRHREVIPPEKRKAWLVITARRKALEYLREVPNG